MLSKSPSSGSDDSPPLLNGAACSEDFELLSLLREGDLRTASGLTFLLPFALLERDRFRLESLFGEQDLLRRRVCRPRSVDLSFVDSVLCISKVSPLSWILVISMMAVQATASFCVNRSWGGGIPC